MLFRVNFLARTGATLLWLVLLVLFFQLIFQETRSIGDWGPQHYLIFMGTGFLITGLVDSFFLDNCTNFAERVRTGNLDFVLTKPVDEQFLLSCERIDWSEIPTALFGLVLVVYGAARSGITITPLVLGSYFCLVTCSVVILYSILLIIASSSVWIIRNQSLYELWWYVNQFSRYPAEIYKASGSPLGLSLYFGLTFAIPVLLAVNVPARFIGGLFKAEGMGMIGYLAVMTVVAFVASRAFLRFAISRYRSASS